MKAQQPPSKRALARGTIYNLIAYGVYGATGFAIHVSLAHLLKPNDYGIFGAAFAILNIFNLIIFSGIPKAVAKHIAGNRAQAPAILRSGLRIQFLSSACLFAVIFSGAEWLAITVPKDADLAVYIRLASLSIIPLGLLYIYREMFNGLRDFFTSPLTICITSVVRLVAVVSLVLLGLGIQGAIIGYVFAAVFGLALAWWLCKLPRAAQPYSIKPLVIFAVPLILYNGTLSLLLNIDTVLVKRILGDNFLVGNYTAAAAITHTVFSLFSAFAVALFPSVAKSQTEGASDLTGKYVTQAVRYILMMSIPFAALISATADELVMLVYGGEFSLASRPLSMLILGTPFFSLSYNLGMTLSAAGRPLWPMFTAILTVPASLILTTLLIKQYGLVGAGVATTIVYSLNCLVIGLYTYISFRRLIGWISFYRIIAAGAAVYAIGKIYPVEGLMLVLIYYPFLLGVYVLLLVLFREFADEDYEVIWNILGRRKKAWSLTAED